jgi:hypothetical protein
MPKRLEILSYMVWEEPNYAHRLERNKDNNFVLCPFGYECVSKDKLKCTFDRDALEALADLINQCLQDT